jgi:hypothetical protein
MMVTVALTLFIVVILATAFSTGLETFRQLKAVGDMHDQLRTATNLLRADLSADHFEGKRRLSDAIFWTVGPPREGYFRVTQSDPVNAPNPLNVDEGHDPDGLPSRRRVDHILQFTVKRRGNRPADFFSAVVPQPGSPLLSPLLFPKPDTRFQDPGTSVFNSQWAEVAYFLAPNGADASGTPLFGLYRQQRVVVPDPSALNYGAGLIDITGLTPAALAAYKKQFSCEANPVVNLSHYLYFNSPSALTIPERRMTLFKPGHDDSGIPTGDDLLMTNVVSFDVQLLRSDFPNRASDLAPKYFFDSWSFIQDEWYNYADRTNFPVPQSYTVNGIQITLRVWDARTRQTRQITLIQDL